MFPLDMQIVCLYQVDSKIHVHTLYHWSCSLYHRKILVHMADSDFASDVVDMSQVNKAVALKILLE